MRRLFCALLVVFVVAVSGCSGSGTASTPAAQPTVPGAGINAVFNQKLTFSISVPATTSSSSKRRAGGKRAIAAASPAPTTPYVSPATAAIVLTLAEVNGVSPQKAPPAIPTIPVTCQGCTFSVPNIIAALGVDTYLVQTYSGYAGGHAAGNLISTGFVNAAVPERGSAAIGGGAALSIGGYVAQINLAPAALNFQVGVAGDQSVLASALDAGGATIIGPVQYVAPIVLSVTDATNFSVDGAPSESISGTLQKPIVLHYTGGNSLGTLVQATSQDENGNPVTASVTANVLLPGQTPPPVPSPTPVPTSGPSATPTSGSTPVSTPPYLPPSPTPRPSPIVSAVAPPTLPPSPTPPPAGLSLYVADGVSDTVSEYRIVSQIGAGNIPNPVPTPARVMQFDPTKVTISGFGCTQSAYTLQNSNNPSGNGTNGVAIGSDGTIFTFPTCLDGNNNTYVFGFPATSTGLVGPTIFDPFNAGGFANAAALAYNAQLGIVYAANAGASTYGATSGTVLAGFPTTSNLHQPSIVVGSSCFQEFSESGLCSNPNGNTGQSYSFNLGGASGFGIDSNGYAYVPAFWNDQASQAAAELFEPGALLAVNATRSSSVTQPYSAIAGFNSLIGGSGVNAEPYAATVDGTTLYVLTGNSELFNFDETTSWFPGLTYCPSSAGPHAPTNTVDNVPGGGGPTNCGDQVTHAYLTAFQINQSLLGPASPPYGQDNDLIPQWVVGGDVPGRFGCYFPQNGGGQQSGGEYLAASGGYVYVLNDAPNCSNGAGPEIDVYNTHALISGGAYTNQPPVLIIDLHSSYPSAITIGRSGSVTGGQAVLRLPSHKAYRSYLHRWPQRYRRAMQKRYRPAPYAH